MVGLNVRNPGGYGRNDPRFQGHDDDVNRIATAYSSQENPLMKQAETAGRTAAARRGLLNSTLAGQSARAAVLEQVVPMASQTAGQNFNKNMAGLGYTQDLGRAQQGYRHNQALANQKFGHQRNLARQAFGHQSELERAQYQYSRGLAAQGYAHERGMERVRQIFNREQAGLDRKLQSDLQAGRLSFEAAQNLYERELRERLQNGQLSHAAEQAAFDRESKIALAEMDRDTRLDLAGMEDELQRFKIERDDLRAQADRDLQRELNTDSMKANDRKGVESMLNNAFNDYENAQRSILNNPNLPARERNKLLENAKAMLQMRVGFTRDLYKTSYDWPSNPFTGGTWEAAKTANRNGTDGNAPRRSTGIPLPSDPMVAMMRRRGMSDDAIARRLRRVRGPGSLYGYGGGYGYYGRDSGRGGTAGTGPAGGGGRGGFGGGGQGNGGGVGPGSGGVY